MQSWVEFAPLLAAVSRGWRKAFDIAVAEQGFTDAKALPLLVLRRQGDSIPQGVLAERVGIEGATIVRIIDELEAEQLIERVADRNDRRIKLIELTESGRKAADRLEQAAEKIRISLLGDLPPQQIASAFEILRALNEKLQVPTR